MNNHRRNILLRAALILLLAGAAFFLLMRTAEQSWQDRYQTRETRETGTQAFMDEGIVDWKGNRYRKKPAVTLILLAGIDKDGTEADPAGVNYRNGGQADFLMLLAIDHGEQQVYQLQIDRDTMAEVTVLGFYGNETGTRELQICLAHSYGARPEDNADYTVRAVKKLLNGLEIDGYYMVDYSSVPALTDLLDGYIARHYNQVSNFGKFMDPLADKMLVLSAMCFLVEKGQIPGWVVAVILFREFAVSGLRLIAAERQHVIAAAWSGKIKTTCTMVGLCFVLVFTQYNWLNMLVSAVILITTVYSGVEYFLKNKDVFKDVD